MADSGKQPGKWKWIIIAAAILLVIVTPVIIYAAANIEKKELNESTRAQLGGTFIKLPSGVTHYELKGPRDGPVVVLVHGSTIPMYIWDEQVEELAGAGLQVLRYDLYGKGYSDRPEGNYSQEFYRKQLLELLDKFGFKQPVDLVGVSMGGGLVTDFAANHPERVDRIVLIAPMINSIRDDTNIKLLRPPVWGEFAMRLIATNSIAKRASQLTARSVKAAEYDRMFRQQTFFKGFERASLAMFRSDATTDYTNDYASVGQQPDRQVLLIWGTEDGDISPEMIKQMKIHIVPEQFVQLDGIGHDPQVEVPQIVNGLIINFLKK